MRRTSAVSVSPPPTLSKVLSPRTRRILTCVVRSISPISSRKSVPPLACSNRPMRRSKAPVKAPFSWPKSSLARSSGVSEAQWTATNFSFARGLSSWMAWAASSLPVPLSPCTSTVAREGATCLMVSKTSTIAGDRPIMPSTRNWFWTFERSSLFSRLVLRSRRARLIRISSRSIFTGFVTKS